jgi:tetratricopeptide (TPR) repeat protein
MSSLASATRADMAIEGPLKELSVQDVLQMLDLARKTGVLTVRSQRMKDQAVVHILDGEVVSARRRRSTRLLGQQLLTEGKLSARELERALERQRQDPTERLGAVLVEMGSLDASELERQLRLQVEETIYDLLTWDEGYFRFEEGDRAPDGPVRVRVDSLLMEGARRLDEWTRLGAHVPSSTAIPALSHGGGSTSTIDLRPEAWEVLAEVDGERDIRGISADLGRSALDVARTVHDLVSMNLLTIEEEPAGLGDDSLMARLEELELMLADGKPDQAGRAARELEKTHPERPEPTIIAGRALAAQGRVRAAMDTFEHAVALDPLCIDAHYQLGLAAARTGDHARAMRAWQTFLRLTPGGDREVHVERAMAAMTDLEKALEGASNE